MNVLPYTEKFYVLTIDEHPEPNGEDQFPFISSLDEVHNGFFPCSVNNLHEALQFSTPEAYQPSLDKLRTKWPGARALEVEVTYRELP